MIPDRGRDFYLCHHFQLDSGAHPASCLMVLRTLLVGVNWLGHEAGYFSPSDAEVKNGVVLSLGQL